MKIRIDKNIDKINVNISIQEIDKDKLTLKEKGHM